MADILRVLYAEDNPADADLTKTHFELNAPDFELEVVNTGERCLARLEARACDVLLLDNHLPDMEGTDVLKQMALREIPVPVVMVTGVGDEALAVQVLRLGASDYVSKHWNYLAKLPVVLRQAVTEYRRLQARSQVVGRGPRRILYVERHPADIDLTRTHLSEVAAAHFTIDVVHTAREALAVLPEDKIDLVLADLRLTDMNALELLREMKQRDLRVPLIVITGKGDEHVAVAALKLGASDYIVKRENYLTQLPYAIENAIFRSHLAQANERLQIELAERERLATENTRLLQDAQAALRARDEFLAVAAHEIRGPLTALRLGIQSLQKGKLPAHAFPKVFDIIEREDRKLAQFVDELLDLGRVRAGTFQFTLEEVDLEEVVREVVSRFSAELAQSGSSVFITTQGRLVGQWDRSRLGQVVNNLLSNAIKFGLGKPIDIAITANEAWATLRVRDRGAGIPREMQQQIFEPFHREQSVRNYGGMGLGLYIVRTIVDGLGGRLRVESEPEAGSTLVIELPKARHP
jgi:signal transduction histidine kinase